MKHASAVAAKTKASSSIRLIKDHSKILKLLQFQNCQLINPDFLSFLKKVRHRIHNIFDNEAENKVYKFWKYWLLVSTIGPRMADISVSAHLYSP